MKLFEILVPLLVLVLVPTLLGFGYEWATSKVVNGGQSPSQSFMPAATPFVSPMCGAYNENCSAPAIQQFLYGTPVPSGGLILHR